jgi:hypothetical protein
MDKSALFKSRVSTKTAEIKIPEVGTITVRALSRAEMLLANKSHEGDPLGWERYVLARAMVDPEMTEKDVQKWQEASLPDEINEVAKAVNHLSGIGPDVAKEAYKSV